MHIRPVYRKKKVVKEIAVHVAIWLLFFAILNYQIYSEIGFIPGEILYRNLYRFVIYVGLFYFNYYILVPGFLLRKKLLVYALVSFSAIVMASMLAGSMAPRPVSAVFITERGKGEDTMSRKDSRGYRFRMPFTIGPAKEGPVPPPFMPGDTTNLKQLEYHFPNHPVPPDSWRFRFLMLLRPAGLMGIYFIIGAAVRIYMEWRKGEAVRQQIQSEKMTSELQFLKAQLNPHFLFNSLNSVYSLSVKKSNDTPEAILTLSELMRYMLYEANRDFVPLGKELDYIKNYIKLQRLRLSDGEKVTLNIYGNERDKKIQPLLFISFIENAFKYGTDYTGKTVVKTVISIRDDSIHFFISNIVGSYKKDTESSGVGLQNIRNRLDLLYPDMHKLDVTDDGKTFTVSLTLNFGSK